MDRSKRRVQSREVTFSDLPHYVIEKFPSNDRADTILHTFEIMHHSIEIANDDLATALTKLTEEKRTIILLYYFARMTDPEISQYLNLRLTNVSKIRERTINALKKQMGGTKL